MLTNSKILITGGTGFIGSNIIPFLKRNSKFCICSPTRAELNTLNESEVCDYLTKNKFDVVLHLANPNASKNPLDSKYDIGDAGLKCFLNFYKYQNLYKKMIYLGSGAEYDKTNDINFIDENCDRNIPQDSYGFSKYIMNKLAIQSSNIYNFRVFGCYGPGDATTKFITHCIRSVLLRKPISIRKDCEFDYLHVFDLARFIEWGISNDMMKHDYNVSSGEAYLLSQIADKILKFMNEKSGYYIISSERNKNYTASNKRILQESGIRPEYSIDNGILLQIDWEKKHWNSNTEFDGE